MDLSRLLTAAVLSFGLLAGAAVANGPGRGPVADCGCDGGCDDGSCGDGLICKLICFNKKVVKIRWGCECDSICIPGHSSNCGTCTASCCPESCGDCCDAKGCDCCKQRPCGTVHYRKWAPTDACRKDVKRLVKYKCIVCIPSYKWVVVKACDFAGPDAKPVPTKPAPQDARVGQEYELSKAELKAIAKHTQVKPVSAQQPAKTKKGVLSSLSSLLSK